MSLVGCVINHIDCLISFTDMLEFVVYRCASLLLFSKTMVTVRSIADFIFRNRCFYSSYEFLY